MDISLSLLALVLLAVGFVTGAFFGFAIAERVAREVAAIVMINMQEMVSALSRGESGDYREKPTYEEMEAATKCINFVADLLEQQHDEYAEKQYAECDEERNAR